NARWQHFRQCWRQYSSWKSPLRDVVWRLSLVSAPTDSEPGQAILALPSALSKPLRDLFLPRVRQWRPSAVRSARKAQDGSRRQRRRRGSQRNQAMDQRLVNIEHKGETDEGRFRDLRNEDRRRGAKPLGEGRRCLPPSRWLTERVA